MILKYISISVNPCEIYKTQKSSSGIIKNKYYAHTVLCFETDFL